MWCAQRATCRAHAATVIRVCSDRAAAIACMYASHPRVCARKRAPSPESKHDVCAVMRAPVRKRARASEHGSRVSSRNSLRVPSGSSARELARRNSVRRRLRACAHKPSPQRGDRVRARAATGAHLSGCHPAASNHSRQLCHRCSPAGRRSTGNAGAAREQRTAHARACVAQATCTRASTRTRARGRCKRTRRSMRPRLDQTAALGPCTACAWSCRSCRSTATSVQLARVSRCGCAQHRARPFRAAAARPQRTPA